MTVIGVAFLLFLIFHPHFQLKSYLKFHEKKKKVNGTTP